MPRPHLGGGIKRWCCLTSVCLAVWRLSVAYIGSTSRTERPTKTKIGIEVAHVTPDSDTTFKVKGQGHQAALLTAVLTRQSAATVSVGTYWPCEPNAIRCGSALCRRGRLGGARRFGAHRGRRGRGHIVAAARLQFVSVNSSAVSLTRGRGGVQWQLSCHHEETMWILWKVFLRTKRPKTRTLEHYSHVCKNQRFQYPLS